MGIIEKQADYFFLCHFHRGGGDYKEAIDQLRRELLEYRKIPHQAIFLQEVMRRTKVEYDEHYAECTNTATCPRNSFYENALFFMQNEWDELQSQLTGEDFTPAEQQQLTTDVQTMLTDLQKIQWGQQMTYDDFMTEFQELRELYFLNKKTWSQLFIGKVTEMVASGAISEAVSRDIVEFVKQHLPK